VQGIAVQHGAETGWLRLVEHKQRDVALVRLVGNPSGHWRSVRQAHEVHQQSGGGAAEGRRAGQHSVRAEQDTDAKNLTSG
jgi:hypothetical protein